MKIGFIAATAIAMVLCTPAIAAEPMAAESIAANPTKAEISLNNVVIDIYTGFNQDGSIKPPRNLTSEEAVRISAIDRHCAAVAKSAEGELKLYLKNGGKMTLWQGLGLLLGKFLGGMTGLTALNALGYGGGAGLGAGYGATSITVPQIVGAIHASCVGQWIARERNDEGVLGDVMAFAAPQLHSPNYRVSDPGTAPAEDRDAPAPEAEMPPQ